MVRNLLSLWIGLFIVLPVHSQTNRALFVVIGNYDLATYGWRKLNCLNDYNLLKPLLVANNYSEQNIAALKDHQATKAGIVKALNRLRQQTQQGDYIYIHFSGHGQQMADDNFDEADGWDEAFIPYDAYYKYEPGYYEGEKHLRDDELEKHLDAIRLKAGPQGNVVVVMDACHSATGTREGEEEYIRGTHAKFDRVRYKEERVAGKQKNKLTNHPQMAALTVFSACQAGETNYEYPYSATIHYGRLSFGLYQQLSQNKTYTVKSLMQAIKAWYASVAGKIKQTPYYESTHENMIFKLGR